jgi:hypothetical protein
MATKLEADAGQGAMSLTIDDPTGCLFDVFYQFGLLWSAFDSWEIVELGVVSGTTVLASPLARAYRAGDLLVPLAYGFVERGGVTQLTSP